MAADVVALVKDFEAGTRIADAVSALGKDIDFPDDAGDLEGILSKNTTLVIVDLDLESGDPLDVVKRLRSVYPDLSVVGLQPRVRKQDYMRARQAGCTWVFSAPSLVKNLPNLLSAPKREQAGDSD